MILVRPSGFGHDETTAPSNAFQRDVHVSDMGKMAAAEFDGLLDALRQCGIGTIVLDPPSPDTPNAVFPNNWFSTHADGSVVIYPMLTPSRRRERDQQLTRWLREADRHVSQVVDLSAAENDGSYLEGTGSLVLDRRSRLAFAALSPRTTDRCLKDWCDRMDFTAIPFTATMDGKLTGDPIYHTNVMMSIGEEFAAICLDSIPYPAERQEVQEELTKAGKEIITIDLQQMHSFLGNLLQLRGRPIDATSRDDRSIFLSETAFHSLRPDQRIALQAHGQLVPVAIPTIEAVGGGSVRCMLAENFLPLRS